MTAGPFNDRDRREENADPVWRLLARSPLPLPDGWFSARTLARCRNVQVARQSRRAKLAWLWRGLAGAGLAACLAIFLVGREAAPSASSSVVAGQRNVQEAFEILATMQPDTDTSSSSSWQDSDL